MELNLQDAVDEDVSKVKDVQDDFDNQSLSEILRSSSDSNENLEVFAKHGFDSPEAAAAHQHDNKIYDWDEFKE